LVRRTTTSAILIRRRLGVVGSLMTPNKKSTGEIAGFAAAAASAAFLRAVFLLGVPRWRPPRRSPGFEPLGIANDHALLAIPQCTDLPRSLAVPSPKTGVVPRRFAFAGDHRPARAGACSERGAALGVSPPIGPWVLKGPGKGSLPECGKLFVRGPVITHIPTPKLTRKPHVDGSPRRSLQSRPGVPPRRRGRLARSIAGLRAAPARTARCRRSSRSRR
jgi:hypothetical protein